MKLIQNLIAGGVMAAGVLFLPMPVEAKAVQKPTCVLTASDYYPGNPGTPVTLKWKSENARYALVSKYVAHAPSDPTEIKVRANGKMVVRPNSTTTYTYTFYGRGGMTSCSVTLGLKG